MPKTGTKAPPSASRKAPSAKSDKSDKSDKKNPAPAPAQPAGSSTNNGTGGTLEVIDSRTRKEYSVPVADFAREAEAVDGAAAVGAPHPSIEIVAKPAWRALRAGMSPISRGT